MERSQAAALPLVKCINACLKLKKIDCDDIYLENSSINIITDECRLPENSYRLLKFSVGKIYGSYCPTESVRDKNKLAFYFGVAKNNNNFT